MPAKENFFSRFKNTAVRKMNRFLYGERDSGYGYSSGAVYDMDEPPYEPEQQPAPRRRRGQYREERYAQEEQRMNDQQPMYQQPAYQQAPYQQQAYQQPYPQQGYPQQQAYQQPQAPYQQPVTQFTAQMDEQRARNPQAQQPEQPKVVPFPGSYSGEQEARPASVRVITIRGFNDCRSAISYLRAGEILLVVMDGIQDQAEMRRYVDMLAGACFSLSASITKVSRYGSYLAAPGQVSVWADPVISQMNGSGRRARAPQPQSPYRPAQGDYQQQAYPDYGRQDPQSPYQPPYVQQSAADGTEFYPRQPQPTPEQPPFEAQERGTGYAPDHEAEAL